MTETRTFTLPPDAGIMVASSSGTVTVTAEPRDDVTATGNAIRAEWEDGGTTLVLGRHSKGIDIRCPEGTPVTVGTASGHVRLTGRFGKVSVTSASGAIVVDEADGADLRTVGGTIEIGTCTGPCRVTTATGKIIGGKTAAVHAHSMSGAIRIARAAGDVHARTVSGAIEVHCSGVVEIDVRTVSGKVLIGLPENATPHLRLRTLGRVRSPIEWESKAGPGRGAEDTEAQEGGGSPVGDGSECTVDAVSVSGSIDVRVEPAIAGT